MTDARNIVCALAYNFASASPLLLLLLLLLLLPQLFLPLHFHCRSCCCVALHCAVLCCVRQLQIALFCCCCCRNKHSSCELNSLSNRLIPRSLFAPKPTSKPKLLSTLFLMPLLPPNCMQNICAKLLDAEFRSISSRLVSFRFVSSSLV